MQMTYVHFQHFKTLTQTHFSDTKLMAKDKSHPLILKSLLICLSRGVDRISNIDVSTSGQTISKLNKADQELLTWFNHSIRLDGELTTGAIQLKFEHIAIMIRAINKAGIKADVLKMESEEAREFINACGRTLQCYTSPIIQEHYFINKNKKPEDALATLLKTSSNKSLKFQDPGPL